MCGNETQMSHFFDAFASGVYDTGFDCPSAAKAGTISSAWYGNHSAATAALLAAKQTVAATVKLLRILGFMTISSFNGGKDVKVLCAAAPNDCRIPGARPAPGRRRPGRTGP